MLEFEKEGSDIKRSILKLEEATPLPNHGNRYRTVFKTRHGRQVFLSLERSGEDLIIENCRYLDRGQRRSNDSLVPKKLQTRRFPVDKLLAVIASQLDKTFYGVEYVQNDTAGLPLEEYLQRKAGEANRKYRFLILVGEGERVNGLPIRLRTRLKNKLHRAIYLDLAYYKDGLGLVRQCSYYDRRYQQRAVPVTPPTLVSCFFPYAKEEILSLVNQEICCDFTHILVTEGIDLDSNTTPLCGAI